MRSRSDILIARETLIQYLEMKVKEQDWHGVADAAMDLRELEVELKCSTS